MLIECLAGPITENVMGHGYTFARDRYGRCVAEVLNKKHQKCFLSVVAHYREVPEIPVDLPAPDTPGLMGEILEGDGAVPGLGDLSQIENEPDPADETENDEPDTGDVETVEADADSADDDAADGEGDEPDPADETQPAKRGRGRPRKN